MRVGVREVFAYHSVELVLLADCNMNEIVSITFFLNAKAIHPFEVCSVPTLTFSETHPYQQSVPQITL